MPTQNKRLHESDYNDNIPIVIIPQFIPFMHTTKMLESCVDQIREQCISAVQSRLPSRLY